MIEFIWRQIERALSLWTKYRSALHGRIAWLIVFAGVAIVATPWWLPIIIQLLKQNTALDVTGLDTIAQATDPLYGIITIAMGLIYHGWFVLKAGRDQRAGEERDRTRIAMHDRPIYDVLTQKLDERWLRHLTDMLGADHSYSSDDGRVLDRVIEYLDLTANQFLSPEVDAARKNLLVALNRLDNFLSVRFFIHPRDQSATINHRLCMQPEHNIDRSVHVSREDELYYIELTDELNGHLDTVVDAYDSFTLTAKAKLLAA